MRFKSIRRKINFTLAIVLLINSVIIISLIVLITYQKMDKQKKQYLSELVLGKSNKINSYLKNVTDFTKYLATAKNIIEATDNPSDTNIQKAVNFLNETNRVNSYPVIVVLNQQGAPIISTDSTLYGADYSFRPFFKEALSGKFGAYTTIGAITKTQGYYFFEPIRKSDGQIIGVLVVKLVPDGLYKILDEESKYEQSHIMITDPYGVIVYSDIKDRLFSSLGALKQDDFKKIKDEKKFIDTKINPLEYQEIQDDLNKLNNREIKIYNFKDKIDKDKELIGVTSINDYSLFLVVEDSANSVNNDTYNLVINVAIIIIISKLIIIIILSLLTYKNLKPLKELEKMAKKVSGGDLNLVNNIKSGDELEELGNSFVETTVKLKNYYNNLEEEVSTRTKELNDKNKYLNNIKLATLNILEDIQEEKNKTIILAKDLEKFKLALDNASDLVLITNTDGIVLYCNNSVKRITGYSVSETVGKKVGVLWHLPMSKNYYANLWKTIKDNKKSFEGEIKNRRKGGEVYDAKITISPILSNTGNVEFFIGIQRDITHEKMVDQAKTEFVSLASHQLRTPLSSVNWYAEMLLAGDGGKLNEEQTSFVKEIYAGNQRMVDLVNSLLNVSRLELGTFAVEPEPTDVVAMAQDVINELQPGIVQKKLKLDFIHNPDIPIINADPKLFRIVFQNLLSNAIKYTPESGAVSLKLSKNKKDLLIEVADNGYGIPKSDQSRIFQKLFRAENVREKDTEGTGLGLYIIKSIIDHAGGKITFTSEENKGTTFYLQIPLTGMKKKEGNKKIE